MYFSDDIEIFRMLSSTISAQVTFLFIKTLKITTGYKMANKYLMVQASVCVCIKIGQSSLQMYRTEIVILILYICIV